MIYTPSTDLKMELYVDADFAGLYNVENSDDPISAKSRSGFIICFANCPIAWVSKLQTEISLSTTESEILALSAALRVFLPMKRLTEFIAKRFSGVTSDIKYTGKSHIWEDNASAVTLCDKKNITTRTRHIATKYFWFLDKVNYPNSELRVLKIDGKVNVADIMTKNTDKTTFLRLRKLMCGW